MYTLFQSLIARKPLLIQIENYCTWKGIRFPLVADSHEKVLIDFSTWSRLRHVSDIRVQHVVGFADLHSSEYFRTEIIHIIRQFLKYCRAMGFVCLQLEAVKPTGILPTHMTQNKVHHLLHVDQVKRVKRLKNEKVNGKQRTFREVQALMETQDKRKYDLKNLFLWYHYQLPEGV